jgi:hypothetical protein
MGGRRFFALQCTIAHAALYFATGCPQLLRDEFALAPPNNSTSGAGGIVRSGSNGGASAGGSAAGGATAGGSDGRGAAPVDSPPDAGDAAAGGGASTPGPCAPGALGPDGATCYYLASTSASWFDARQTCLDAARLLVQLDSAEEDTFVAGLSSRSLWIGASDTAVDGTFVWGDGSPIVYSNWGPEQPDDYAGYACAEKRQDELELWYDQPCEDLRRYVCESQVALQDAAVPF